MKKIFLFLSLFLLLGLIACTSSNAPSIGSGVSDNIAISAPSTTADKDLETQSASADNMVADSEGALETAASAPATSASGNTEPFVATAASVKVVDNKIFWHLKYVPVEISDTDLDKIASLGFTVLGTEWGVDDAGYDEVRDLLDRVGQRGMKLVLDGGFSAGAWGYAEDGSESPEQTPVWQAQKMTAWINEFNNHPALYGWDISNEAGENWPNGDVMRIALDQLQSTAALVRSLDPGHPIVMRMHYWDEYDGDFDWKNPFSSGLADIIILNLYSNFSQNGRTIYLSDIVSSSAQELIGKIKEVDADVRIWISLAAYADYPSFLLPTADNLSRDLEAVLALPDIASIGFFGWGSEDDDWYLPRDGDDLLAVIRDNINSSN